ncbi:unnamed protein product, partial [Meganyctiphanes norvegica]
MDEKKKMLNVAYLKSLPGLFVCVQLVLCFLAFVISVSSAVHYSLHASHGFFSFITFLAILSCTVWIFTHTFNLHTLFKKEIDWNHAGLLHNSVWGFFLMAASCAIINIASLDKSLRAAGTFCQCLYCFIMETVTWVWQKN